MATVPDEWRVVFAGTPVFAVPALEALLAAGIRPVAVFTRPDRPAGRGRQVQSSPVKQCAVHHGLPVHQPESMDTAATRADLAALQPDLGIVVAYGQLLPPDLLSLPAHGWVNVHASLLPRWRGAAPIQRALLAGDRETGACIMQLEPGLDTGPVWLCRSLPIEDADTSSTLHEKLAQLGARTLVEALALLAEDNAAPTPQDESRVTKAPRVDKQEAWIDWTRDAQAVWRQVRAFNPWPVAQTRLEGTVLRIWRAQPEDADGTPGVVLSAGTEGILVACGTGALRLDQVQLPGRRRIAAADLAHTMKLAGHRLG